MRKEYPEKVYLVGAGPGDPGLMSVKGLAVLREADVVVYDALAGDAVLGWIPEGARRIDVGKRSGRHSCSQEQINEILCREGRRGGTVVRLKGGDPFVFGRGGEEAGALHEAGIPFEAVPGVTSATAVLAYAGIPATHRGVSSSLHVMTGRRRDGEADPTDYEALVRAGGTDIFLMGVSEAKRICQGLLQAGMERTVPAAFIQEGTTASQKTVISTLEHVVRDAERAGIHAPAILAVGEACAMRKACAWAEARPLHGARIIVTRPRGRADRMASLLRADGAEVLSLPAIQTKRRRGEQEKAALSRVLLRLSEFDWLVFTSPSGAAYFFDEMRERRMDLRVLNGRRIAVIGPATGEEFEKRGIFPDYMPSCYYARDLGEGLCKEASPGSRILLLRAGEGSEALTEALTHGGLAYEDAALYDTRTAPTPPVLERACALLREGRVDFVTFTSASTVRGFLEMTEGTARGFTAVCIGEETARAAKAAGMEAVCSEVPGVESMTACIKERFCRKGL
ncbi:uroporphyrinogen-III C-methyltransferase [Clostridiaceae bacterium]|nr:uroporphyrinogen-III C-methyltransferase [Clostridiaceae bacterium]